MWAKIRKNFVYYLYLIIFVYAVYLVYSFELFTSFRTYDIQKNNLQSKDPYVINTTGCKIENMDAFSDEIMEFLYHLNPLSCSDKHLLTYVNRNGNEISLNINKSVIYDYSSFDINCCYINVDRNPVGANPDDNLSFSECTYFEDSVNLYSEVVKVKCKNPFYTVYENVHAILRPPTNQAPNFNDPNVVLIGIDGVSMTNLLRTMPKTHRLLENTGWIKLKGYNKVEDNTFPNLIAVLAGVRFSLQENDGLQNCSPYRTEKLENCNFIWKTFKENNYSTAYAEDTPTIGTFNFNKAGFKQPPTDYYFRPYFLTANDLPAKYMCLRAHCTGPEKTGVRMQNLVTDFLDTINGKTPGFGLFWMNAFSHEDVNCPSSMDEDFERYFKKLYSNNYLDNTVMIFFSDHGFRFGKIRLTENGWLEERLPFFYIWIPRRLRKLYPEKYRNLLSNTDKLTSPYDVYMSLQDVLSQNNPNYVISQPEGCPKCQSLFKPVSPERTCKDAGIPEHYCSCSNYVKIDKSLPIVEVLANFFIDQLNKLIQSYGYLSNKCAIYRLEKISNVKELILEQDVEINYLISIVTRPEAHFEATIKVNFFGSDFEMSLNEINRLDRYAPTSYCVKNSPVQIYCYCSSLIKKITNIFCNNKFCIL
ncbi:uncharacterized protein LOC130895562 [Diorhabda carinulata]|uniref:uncharacterized protein LOC130895562 n=1 Tax=Diorhabda carinulata TaxID=1163345 RepID=UPI0025A20AE4|nr:uncharacterized protein LOC130895562 [Diorhabda carinulata]